MQSLHYPIRVPSDVLEALGEFTGHFWSDSLALEPFICEAIRNYMQPEAAAPAHDEASAEAGYQWKQIFLPAGTRLRASFGGASYFARVEGDEIQYEGQAMSPSRFANLRGSGNRNAWKAVWLRFPGSDEWLLADVCRSARKAAILRLLEGRARTARVAQGQREHLQQSCARQSAANAPGDLAMKAAGHSNDKQSKSTGRSSRSKRRAAKRLARKFR